MVEHPSDPSELLPPQDDPDEEVLRDRFESLYDELRALAAGSLRADRGATALGVTTLLSEAYLDLAELDTADLRTRARFLAAAAGAMRRVLVDHARRRTERRRAEAPEVVTLEAGMEDEPTQLPLDWDQMLTTDAALVELGRLDERQARVVEMKLFAGMTLAEVAAALSISLPTAGRDWRLGRAFLARALS
jgi:RNA polymerase sigma factor (TIGR02999 family)